MLSFFGGQKKPSGSKLRDLLPATHAFVNFTVRGNGPQGRLCFEGASLKTFRTTKIAGMVPGQEGVFTYENSIGKFTFAARLVSMADDQAIFNLPVDIKTISRTAAGDRRVEPRVDTTVNAEWRYKPVGKIPTSWTKVTISDLSRTSGSMTAEREFKPQELLEIRMTLEGSQALTIDASPLRSEKTGSKYRVSLTFKHTHEDSSHAITRFINKRMTELRSRGLS